MSEKLFFSEEQRIDQLGIKLIMAAVGSVTLMSIAWADWGPPVPIEKLMTLIGVVLALIFANLMVFAVKLETKITDKGIHYKYAPLVWKWKLIPFQEIKGIKWRKYHAWREFGGRGYKRKRFSKLRAIVIKGDQGVVISYGKDKKILLGSQRPHEFKVALNRARGEESAETWQRKRHSH